ncbi:MAG: phenylacetate--CoA ligase family protein [Gammaproteobacteria bacterium]|nr:phenylacetate--CoA ligase family protein [Gammaproteobacteria bacterium]
MYPAAVRCLIYPLHERASRRPTFAYLRELEASQWLDRAGVEALQLGKLTALLRICRDHSPWHAERMAAAGLSVDDGSAPLTMADLRRLPLMDKADAMANQARIAWQGVPGGAFRYTTGGSSGTPLIFYFGRYRQASDAAGRMRARRWWGVDVGEPEVYLWGAPVELNKTDRIKRIRDRLVNHLVLNAFDMSAATMDHYMEAIRCYKPACIYGYASSVALLAAHAETQGKTLKLPSLKVVCTTGEPLYPEQRELIGRVFGVPVANEFGSRDIGFTAHESPAGQMLLMSESIILEVLDAEGRPVKPGETGEAVMTGLCSEAQPFIRYRTGDMVRVTDERCAEGRGLHVIGAVEGRKTDFVVRADGTIMHALSIIYVLREQEQIREFKFIQHETRRVQVLIVPRAGWNEESARRVVAGLQARLGQDCAVEISLVDDIAPEASGKHRYVVSHVKPPI